MRRSLNLQDGGNQLSGVLLLRFLDHLCDIPFLDQHAAAQDHNPVAEAADDSDQDKNENTAGLDA